MTPVLMGHWYAKIIEESLWIVLVEQLIARCELRDWSVGRLSATCAFRFEHRPENELVEIENDGASARICENCLVLVVVHRRIHHMRLENIIRQMAKH